MKRYEFTITDYYVEKFFCPIRTKADIISTLMELLNFIILNPKIPEKAVHTWKIVLYIDKMSRFFVYSEKKYFTLVNPFTVKEVQNWLEFTFSSKIIDYAIISRIQSLIKTEAFSWSCSLSFIEEIYDYDSNFWEDLWLVFRELLLMEDWYIRYDYDPVNYIIHKKKGQEHRHPLLHYDLFYSSRATFKLGIKSDQNDIDDFINLLNLSTDCIYLED